MIVILEGANGVGKSTYAHKLSETLKLPICRPFRHRNTDIHWSKGSELEKKLERFGVPTNTHVEDLYVADFLAAFKVGAVLDRFLPSALAYAEMKGEGYPSAEAKALLSFWQELLEPAVEPKLYVWLRAPYEIAKKRAEGRNIHSMNPNKAQYETLEKVYGRVFQSIEMPKRQINTAEVGIDDGVGAICRALKS